MKHILLSDIKGIVKMHSKFKDEKCMLGGQTVRNQQEHPWIIMLVALQDQQ